MNTAHKSSFHEQESPPGFAGPEVTGSEGRITPPVTAPFPRPLRILVVDDEESVRVSLNMLLRFDGHLVDTASSGEAALAMFRERCFDLVITDYSITGMDGPEFAAAIKASDQRCPVVMITAYAPTLPRSLPCVDAIVSKPFSSQELSDAIAKTMEARARDSVRG